MEKRLANREVLTVSPAYVRATPRMARGTRATAPLPTRTLPLGDRPCQLASCCCESIASRCAKLAGPWIPDSARSLLEHNRRLWDCTTVSGIQEECASFSLEICKHKGSQRVLHRETPCLSTRPASRRHRRFLMVLDIEVRSQAESDDRSLGHEREPSSLLFFLNGRVCHIYLSSY